ncbi:MAG TPA: F0F1 ATP synthase subunit A [Flavobacteriales bacterium]|jgi:F-type H+-transporting ATPase subunit a|nr:F0F1 ATP synthase subunit A [Flavobacteriales bacterium]HJN64322.1 F0F1 ATP synthase subunit A [Flavobacteriales bacterium]
MRAVIRLIACVFVLGFFAIKSYSFVPNTEQANQKNETYDPVPNIMHHIADAHEWHLWGEEENSFSIPLPVILFTEGHLDVFLSSKFHHGHSTVTKGNRVYSIDSHGHIHEGSGLSVIDISITKNVAFMLISVLLLLLIFISIAKTYNKNKKAPTGFQAFLEPLILFVKDDIIKDNIGPKYEKYTPFLLTVFFFVLINNLMGMLPGSANVTGNIAVTFVLSVFTFIITTISGNKNYWGHIFKPPGVPLALMPIMVPIEIIGIFTKPFALMIRLFANITAGHIIILSLISLIFIAQSAMGNAGAWGVAPVSVLFVLFIYCIELLVAFLQAYIFTLLSAVFIGLAVAEDH